MSSFEFDRVLTIGAGGMIGAYVDFGMRPSRSALDVLDEKAVLRYVAEHKPSAIIHLAGATDMARCEQDPAYAYELNVRGTYNVARAACAHGAVMVYASTSRVFRGDKAVPYEEDDVPEPDTHYGRTKHIGEIIVQSLVPQHIIARTAWVFGGGPERDNKFYGKMIRQLQTRGTDAVALNDVYGSPTYGKDYIAAVKILLAEGAHGTFHIANSGVATRYDLAGAIAEQLESDADIRGVERSFFPSGAELPTNESIVSARVTMRPWQDALKEYLSLEWKMHA
ncbi:MAG TPA: NAD(P)-dependent oxidoreductase [Candidatus Paceibacterota bacterium]|nr:NAD(P)-dependent oxidoreductase [Candidatus Paceibacterota bacterium]